MRVIALALDGAQTEKSTNRASLDKVRSKEAKEVLSTWNGGTSDSSKIWENLTVCRTQAPKVTHTENQKILPTWEDFRVGSKALQDGYCIPCWNNRWRRKPLDLLDNSILEGRRQRETSTNPFFEHSKHVNSASHMVIYTTKPELTIRQKTQICNLQQPYTIQPAIQRLQNITNFIQNTAIYDSKEGTSIFTNTILRGMGKHGTRFKGIPRSLHKGILENTDVKLIETEILRISEQSKEEKLYDITTTLGNYISDGHIVHNSSLTLWLMHDILRRLYPAKNEQEIWELTKQLTVFEVNAGVNGGYQAVTELWQSSEWGRCPILMWDDMGAWMSNLELEGQVMRKWLAGLQMVRTQVAVFFATMTNLNVIKRRIRMGYKGQVHIFSEKRAAAFYYYHEMVDLDDVEHTKIIAKPTQILWMRKLPEEMEAWYKPLRKDMAVKKKTIVDEGLAEEREKAEINRKRRTLKNIELDEKLKAAGVNYQPGTA